MWRKIFGGKEASVPTGDDLPSRSPVLCGDGLPRHIAVVMDGNGRWAQAQGRSRSAGHEAGARTLKRIVRAASDMGIEVLTVYAFSTENWKRPQLEVDFLLNLFDSFLQKEIDEMHAEHVRIRFIGRRDRFTDRFLRRMTDAEVRTAENTGIRLNVAVNYGGQDEILRAVQTLAARAAAGEIAPPEIDEALFSRTLDTADDPPVDLFIRTSGDLRLSNFLLWQSAYAELYFTETHWPDFTAEELARAITDFAGRSRRFGGLSEED
ncbi:isoprenyl transferase [uncultured Selenomonas sp.]|uniref:isoprenyl transferase n=1 Tax=uncultured Selenomonas sp. TaxID=159275 RepID=UPI0028D8519D|nr:isoprenyl transferase [uncultured Selenomonas sp.]